MQKERKRAAAEARERAKRQQARARGLVPIGWAARWLKTDRRQLAKLHESEAVPGERIDGTIALDRRALAAWAFSRPRCIVDGCARRVLREGLGCSRHPNHGKQHTDETKQLMSQRRYDYWGGRRPSVARTCEWCGKEFELSAREAGLRSGRFCTLDCLNTWLHAGDGADERRQARDDGEREWQARRDAEKARLKRDNFIVGYEALSAELSRKHTRHRRSPTALSQHAAAERLLVPAMRLDALRIVAFTPDSITNLVQQFESYPDGRLRRFARPRFRSRWELGREAGVLFRAGYSTTEAARELGYTRDYVEKLWKRREITAEVEAARLRRRVLVLLDEAGDCLEFREAYRTLHIGAADAMRLIDELEERGEVERSAVGRRLILRRVSQIPD
jgi:hypothetical protein